MSDDDEVSRKAGLRVERLAKAIEAARARERGEAPAAPDPAPSPSDGDSARTAADDLSPEARARRADLVAALREAHQSEAAQADRPFAAALDPPAQPPRGAAPVAEPSGEARETPAGGGAHQTGAPPVAPATIADPEPGGAMHARPDTDAARAPTPAQHTPEPDTAGPAEAGEGPAQDAADAAATAPAPEDAPLSDASAGGGAAPQEPEPLPTLVLSSPQPDGSIVVPLPVASRAAEAAADEPEPAKAPPPIRPAAPVRPLLVLRGVATDIGRYRILQGVDLMVPEGAVTMLLGRNGAGKTTTLRTIMGLWRARSGDIRFDGTDLRRLRPSAIARRGVGYVPESMGVFGDLTVAENMALAARGGRIPADRQQWIFETFPPVRTFWRARAGTLSGGQKQMLAVARAMAEPRKLYLIDEPTKGLAPAIVTMLARALLDLKSQGASILLVEQNLAVAEKLGDRAVIIEDGRSTWSGRMADLAADDALQRRHLGLGLAAS